MYITCTYYVKTIVNKLWLNIFQILCLDSHGCLTPFLCTRLQDNQIAPMEYNIVMLLP